MSIVDTKSSYRQIFKATSIFGGIQVFSIIINLFKSKIIAIFIGPEGYGILNLLQYPINLLIQLSSLGIPTSGIREIAKVADSSVETYSRTIIIMRYWTRITGFIGMIFACIFASQLSIYSFGTDNYTNAFRILSITILITALGSESNVILRGKRMLKEVAKAGIYSSATSFIISIPLYYYFQINGVTLVLIITSISVFLFNLYFSKKVKSTPKKVKMTAKEIFNGGRTMASIGVYIVLGDLIYTAIISIVNMYIRSNGSIADVGLFQAAMQITNSSIGLVFTAMAGDFYPRIAAIRNDWKKISAIASQQAEIASLFCTPTIIGMIIFSPLLINILFSDSFQPINNIVQWTLYATIFKVYTWTTIYVLLAQGKTKAYLILVVINNIMLLPFYCIGYQIKGLTGVGIGYVILMIMYATIQHIIISNKYSFKFSTTFKKLQLLSITLCSIALVLVSFLKGWKMYTAGTILLLPVFIYYIYLINQRIDIFSIIKSKIK